MAQVSDDLASRQDFLEQLDTAVGANKYPEIRSVPKLAKWLNAEGYRRKAYVSRRRGKTGGEPFTTAVVRGMLKNRLYLGEVSHQDQFFRGQHEAIVSLQAFEAAARVMEANTVKRGRPPTRARYDYLLTGLVRCACGSALTTSSGTSRTGAMHFYYRCVGKMKKLGHSCPVKNINAEKLEERVISVIREAACTPKIVESAMAEANRLARESADPVRERVQVMRRDLAKATSDAERLLTLILEQGLMDSETAKTRLTEAEDRKRQLTTALGEAESQLIELESRELDLEIVRASLEGFDVAFDHLTTAEKRELLALLIEQVIVHDKEKVELRLHNGHGAIGWLVDNPDKVPTEHETPGVNQGFVNGWKWLPLLDSNQRPSD